MTQIAMGHTFVSALTKLDPTAVHQITEFLERLVRDPDSIPAETEVGRDPLQYCAEAFWVSEYLRAIGRRDGDQLLLLYVGACNDAYDWATSRCFARNEPRAGRRIAVGEIPRGTVPGLMGGSLTEAWYCPIADTYQLHQALEIAGVGQTRL
jgi:hypothetical protein